VHVLPAHLAQHIGVLVLGADGVDDAGVEDACAPPPQAAVATASPAMTMAATSLSRFLRLFGLRCVGSVGFGVLLGGLAQSVLWVRRSSRPVRKVMARS